jgi:hypothetical protein
MLRDRVFHLFLPSLCGFKNNQKFTEYLHLSTLGVIGFVSLGNLFNNCFVWPGRNVEEKGWITGYTRQISLSHQLWGSNYTIWRQWDIFHFLTGRLLYHHRYNATLRFSLSDFDVCVSNSNHVQTM